MTSTPDDGVAYCTPEDVQAAIDQADGIRLNKVIYQACRAASREVEGECHRRFYPVTGTVYPSFRHVAGDTLWMNSQDHEIIALDTLVVDGTTLTEGTDYYLDRPAGQGPPYTAIRLYRDATAAWPSDQRDIVAVGRFGGHCGSEPAGILASSIAAASTTTMTVTDSSVLGVGDLILVDAERVVVTGKASSATGATLSGNLTTDMSEVLIAVSSGALVHAGETVMVGAERMFVEDVAGNNLVVRRAVNSSTLAAHTAGDAVWAPRLCTITRGAAGTTAGAHGTASELFRNVPPSLIHEAAMARAIDYVEQAKAGYSRTAGAGDNRRESGGTGVQAAVAAAREAAYTAYGRQGRIGGW